MLHTGMEGGLKGGKSIIFEHVQQRLQKSNSDTTQCHIKEKRTVFPALSRPRNKILAFLCSKPGSMDNTSVDRRRREGRRTYLAERGRPKTSLEWTWLVIFAYQTRNIEERGFDTRLWREDSPAYMPATWVRITPFRHTGDPAMWFSHNSTWSCALYLLITFTWPLLTQLWR